MRRRRTRPRRLPIGAISEGSTKVEDLFPALLGTMNGVLLRANDRWKVSELEDRWVAQQGPDPDPEALDHIYEELTDIANEYLPDFCVLGMHEGDGACLGVWVSDDALREAEASGDLKRGKDLPPAMVRGGPDWYLITNDHGNMTLLVKRYNRWITLWETV